MVFTIVLGVTIVAFAAAVLISAFNLLDDWGVWKEMFGGTKEKDRNKAPDSMNALIAAEKRLAEVGMASSVSVSEFEDALSRMNTHTACDKHNAAKYGVYEAKRTESNKLGDIRYGELGIEIFDGNIWVKASHPKDTSPLSPRTCPNCGAPVSGSMCEYCGSVFEKQEKPEIIGQYHGKPAVIDGERTVRCYNPDRGIWEYVPENPAKSINTPKMPTKEING